MEVPYEVPVLVHRGISPCRHSLYLRYRLSASLSPTYDQTNAFTDTSTRSSSWPESSTSTCPTTETRSHVDTNSDGYRHP
jgi:hypothetical protein